MAPVREWLFEGWRECRPELDRGWIPSCAHVTGPLLPHRWPRHRKNGMLMKDRIGIVMDWLADSPRWFAVIQNLLGLVLFFGFLGTFVAGYAVVLYLMHSG